MSNHISYSTPPHDGFDNSVWFGNETKSPISEEPHHDNTKAPRTHASTPLERASPSKKKRTSILPDYFSTKTTEPDRRDSAISSKTDFNDRSSDKDTPVGGLVENSPATSAEEESTGSGTSEKDLELDAIAVKQVDEPSLLDTFDGDSFRTRELEPALFGRYLDGDSQGQFQLLDKDPILPEVLEDQRDLITSSVVDGHTGPLSDQEYVSDNKNQFESEWHEEQLQLNTTDLGFLVGMKDLERPNTPLVDDSTELTRSQEQLSIIDGSDHQTTSSNDQGHLGPSDFLFQNYGMLEGQRGLDASGVVDTQVELMGDQATSRLNIAWQAELSERQAQLIPSNLNLERRNYRPGLVYNFVPLHKMIEENKRQLAALEYAEEQKQNKWVYEQGLFGPSASMVQPFRMLGDHGGLGSSSVGRSATGFLGDQVGVNPSDFTNHQMGFLEDQGQFSTMNPDKHQLSTVGVIDYQGGFNSFKEMVNGREFLVADAGGWEHTSQLLEPEIAKAAEALIKLSLDSWPVICNFASPLATEESEEQFLGGLVELMGNTDSKAPTQDVIDAASSLIHIKYHSASETSGTAKQILEYALLKSLGINCDSIDEVLTHMDDGDFLRVYSARDIPQGYEAFQAMEQGLFQLQFGSLPPVPIRPACGRTTSMSSLSTAVNSEPGAVIVHEASSSAATTPPAAFSELFGREDTVLDPDNQAPEKILEYVNPKDLVPEPPEYDPIDSENIIPAEITDVPRDDTMAAVAVEVGPELIAQQDVVLKEGTPEPFIPDIVVPNDIQESLAAGFKHNVDALNDAVSETEVLENLPGHDTPATTTLAFPEESKKSKNKKKKKKKKTTPILENLPPPSLPSQGQILSALSSHSQIGSLVRNMIAFLDCAENTTMSLKKMQDSLKALFDSTLETRIGPVTTYIPNERLIQYVQAFTKEFENIGEFLQVFSILLAVTERDLDRFVGDLRRDENDRVVLCTTMASSNESGVPATLEIPGTSPETAGKASSAASNEVQWTDTNLSSGSMPENQVEPSSQVENTNRNLSLSEIQFVEIVPSACEMSVDIGPVLPSTSSQSLGSPPDELSSVLISDSQQSSSISPEEDVSFHVAQSSPHDILTHSEVVASSLCSGIDGSTTTTVAETEPRNQVSTHQAARIPRSNSLPPVRSCGFEQEDGEVSKKTEDESSDPTEQPPTFITHLPVTRKVVACLLNQELPVYASWQIWYYPGIFTRGKGPRTKQIALDVKVTSIGRNATHKPTYRVPGFNESFDSRFSVSLEDGTFLPVVPSKDQFSHMMLSYRDYLEYNHLFSVNNKPEYLPYSFHIDIFNMYRVLVPQMDDPDQQASVKRQAQQIWELMKTSAIQRFNENIQQQLQKQTKWRARIGTINGAFFKLEGAALKKWSKLREDMEKVHPLKTDQVELLGIQMGFIRLEAAIVSAMTKAIVDRDGETFFETEWDEVLNRRE